jgi:hypothetical protein
MTMHCACLVICYLATLASGLSLSTDASILVNNIWLNVTIGSLELLPSIYVADLVFEPDTSVWTTSLFTLMRPCLNDQLFPNISMSEEEGFRHASIINYRLLTYFFKGNLSHMLRGTLVHVI